MLNIKLTNCRECALASKLIDAIDCQLAKMANNLYLNIAYMLDKPVEGCIISALLHYKRILTFKSCNEDWASDYSISDIASRINFLTVGCKCCDQHSSGEITTTTTTTTIALTAFNAGTTLFVQCSAITEPETITLYHNGIELYPDIGDIVYEDSLGTIPFYTGSGTTRYSSVIPGNEEFATNIDGVVITFSCK